MPALIRLARLLLAIGLGAGSACVAAAPAEAAQHRVKIEQYAYSPASLNVSQGDTVTWTNLDEAEHDVVVRSGPDSFRSPMLKKGQSWSHTFTTAGSYSYYCSVHPDMQAAVAAAPVAAPTPTHDPSAHASAAPPPAATTPPAPSTTAARPTAAASPTAASPTAAAPPPAAAPPAAAVAPASATTTLNPLLLVAGASVAVVVFCLLLMTARPLDQEG